MKIWTNTKTLDGYLDDYEFTSDKNEADVALIGSKAIDPDEFPRLKMIFRAGISKDNLPFAKAEKNGVAIRLPSDRVQELIYDETASFTCYLILRMLYGKVGTIEPWVKFGRTVLSCRKVLVLGMGRVGARVAEKLRPMVDIMTYDVMTNSESELPALISAADCVSLHIPNTPENVGFFGAERLSLMKDGAAIVNTARGPIVDEDALYTEIEAGRLSAAFDVYWKEPYDGKLKKFHPDSFFMTPHISSTSDEFLAGAAADMKQYMQEM